MTIKWAADWSRLDRDFIVQAKDRSRVSLVDCARTGGKALQLTTLDGDTDVVGSGAMRRCDVYRCIPGTADPVLEAGAQFWAHSIFLSNYEWQQPTWQPYVLFDFHDNAPLSHAANFHVHLINDGLLRLSRYWGDPINPVGCSVVLGPVPQNEWMDFVHHVKWSDKSDGFFRSWLNGRLVMDQRGPTRYPGYGVYLKLPNYHLPNNTTPSSVVHDRVMLGTTFASVTQ